MCLKGFYGSSPRTLFLAVFAQNGAILCNNDGYMCYDNMKQQEGRLV